jgi:hypothetical protein
VAEAGKTRPPGDDERWAKERRAQGSSVAALNAFSADVGADSRASLGFADPDDAIRALAAEVEAGTLRVPRLLVLDSLVRFASRRADELSAREAALNPLLEGLVRQAQGPEADMAEARIGVRAALDSVAALSGVRSARHPWQVFAQQAAGPLRLTQAEVEKPQCNDREVVKKGDYEAVGVTVEFYTDASPADLRHFCDPRRWHECSAYQHEMTPWSGPGASPDEERPPLGWRRDLIETVELSPAKTLVTPLRFTYTIQDENDPDWVHLDYLLLGETEDILVDEGALDVRRVTAGRHQGRTWVSAKKAILFADPLLAAWPTVACDTFWMDLVIDAAVGCLRRGAPIDSAGGIPKMADSKEVPLTKVIEGATAAAQQSVTAYGKIANEAAAQLAGDSPADADKWVELTTRTWAQAARDAAQAWTTYTSFLQAVAESSEGEGERAASRGTDTDDTESKETGPDA